MAINIHTKRSGVSLFFEALGEGLVAVAEIEARRRRHSEDVLRFNRPYSCDTVYIRVGRIDRIRQNPWWGSRATIVLDDGTDIDVEFGRRERELVAEAGFYL